MPLYAVHAPKGPPSLADADRVTLVRQGFSWAAFLFGPLWLLAKGLWRALIVWALAAVALSLCGYALRAPPGSISAAQFLVALYLGLEAATLRSAALARSGRPLVDMAAASDEDAALRAFFGRWLARSEPVAPREAAPSQAPLAPPRPPVPAALRQPVTGLFPEPGGRSR